MRYLVRARVKAGREADLLEAIESDTLGEGSVAEGEYLRNMKGRAAVRRSDHALGRDLLLPDALAGRTSVLGRIFRPHARAGCARPSQVPRREWNRGVGMQRLRLHGSSGRETDQRAGIRIPLKYSRVRSRTGVQVRSGSASCKLFQILATSLKLNTSAQNGSMRSSANGAVAR